MSSKTAFIMDYNITGFRHSKEGFFGGAYKEKGARSFGGKQINDEISPRGLFLEIIYKNSETLGLIFIPEYAATQYFVILHSQCSMHLHTQCFRLFSKNVANFHS